MRWKCWGLKNNPGFLKSSLVNEYPGHNWGPPVGLFSHFYYKLYIWDWLVDDLEIFHVIVGDCNCVWRFHPKTQERHKRQGWHGRRLNTTKSSFRWQRPSAEKFGKRHLSGMRPSKKEGSFFQKWVRLWPSILFSFKVYSCYSLTCWLTL